MEHLATFRETCETCEGKDRCVGSAQQGGWGVWGGNSVYDDKNNNDDVVAILQRIEILIIMIMMMT